MSGYCENELAGPVLFLFLLLNIASAIYFLCFLVKKNNIKTSSCFYMLHIGLMVRLTMSIFHHKEYYFRIGILFSHNITWVLVGCLVDTMWGCFLTSLILLKPLEDNVKKFGWLIFLGDLLTIGGNFLVCFWRGLWRPCTII